jgi:hypothetical protein
MPKKINSIAIVDGHCLACQARRLRREFSTLNKNPSNSNKIRTPDSSTCTGSPSILPNSSDKTAPDASSRFPPLSRQFHFLRPVRSCSSAQHTATRHCPQVDKHLPPNALPSAAFLEPPRIKIFLALFTNLSCFHRPFCAKMPVH